MTQGEAYLTHWILEGNTNPASNVLWGSRAELFDQNGQRRHAGFKTGTTNDFRDVSGFGYVPGSLVTGVWMGNNNQEPLSNALGQGLFSADGPLYLWHDFMEIALNRQWDWNGRKPVPQTDFAQPAGVTMETVCKFSGMRPGNCGETRAAPVPGGHGPAGRQRALQGLLRHRAGDRAGRPTAAGVDRFGGRLVEPVRQRPDRIEWRSDAAQGELQLPPADRAGARQYGLRLPNLRRGDLHAQAGEDAGPVGRAGTEQAGR